MAMTWFTRATRGERRKRTPLKSAAFRPSLRLGLLVAAALTALALSGCQPHSQVAPPQPPPSSVVPSYDPQPPSSDVPSYDPPPDDCFGSDDALCNGGIVPGDNNGSW